MISEMSEESTRHILSADAIQEVNDDTEADDRPESPARLSVQAGNTYQVPQMMSKEEDHPKTMRTPSMAEILGNRKATLAAALLLLIYFLVCLSMRVSVATAGGFFLSHYLRSMNATLAISNAFFDKLIMLGATKSFSLLCGLAADVWFGHFFMIIFGFVVSFVGLLFVGVHFALPIKVFPVVAKDLGLTGFVLCGLASACFYPVFPVIGANYFHRRNHKNAFLHWLIFAEKLSETIVKVLFAIQYLYHDIYQDSWQMFLAAPAATMLAFIFFMVGKGSWPITRKSGSQLLRGVRATIERLRGRQQSPRQSYHGLAGNKSSSSFHYIGETKMLINILLVNTCILCVGTVTIQTSAMFQLQGAQLIHLSNTTYDDINPAYMEGFTALTLLIVIPVFAFVLSPRLVIKGGFYFASYFKMGIGMVCGSLSVVAFILLQQYIVDMYPDGDKTGYALFYQVPQYALVSVAQVTHIAALEYSYQGAPQMLKCVSVAIYELAIGLSFFVTLIVEKINLTNESSRFDPYDVRDDSMEYTMTIFPLVVSTLGACVFLALAVRAYRQYSGASKQYSPRYNQVRYGSIVVGKAGNNENAS
ncbi:uncharacterized protein LOC106171303 [Lingula anatina]|uniref:Uncharacterized protein LOC106171303 n=1 Tax=Lingula anatina TaxID=7574 RepID=A0A1S3J9G5_LINAN|nr:uncharacterized protein LOC106171303 [Lingula anatina]|eukprot:XP_013407045.2 uncharacterized protein LOC106171303 [Lingula anatina]